MVVATLVKYGMEQGSADKGLVELDAVAVGKEPGTDGVPGDGRDQDCPNADRRDPEAVAGSQDPPDHQADRDSVKDHSVGDPRVLGHQRRTLQKSVYQQARQAGQQGKIIGVGRERSKNPFDEIRCAHPQKEDQNCEDAMVFPGMRQDLPEDDCRYGDVHESVEETYGAAAAV